MYASDRDFFVCKLDPCFSSIGYDSVSFCRLRLSRIMRELHTIRHTTTHLHKNIQKVQVDKTKWLIEAASQIPVLEDPNVLSNIS